MYKMLPGHASYYVSQLDGSLARSNLHSELLLSDKKNGIVLPGDITTKWFLSYAALLHFPASIIASKFLLCCVVNINMRYNS